MVWMVIRSLPCVGELKLLDVMDSYLESIVTELYNQRTGFELMWVELWHTSK